MPSKIWKPRKNGKNRKYPKNKKMRAFWEFKFKRAKTDSKEFKIFKKVSKRNETQTRKN